MEEIGEVLGWAAAVCYLISVANLFAKRIYRRWIAKLPAGSRVRSLYLKWMKLLIKYHRWTGIAAGVFAVIHFSWQSMHEPLSCSGAVLTGLMCLTVLLGIPAAFLHKSSLVKIHRPAALLILAVLLFHLIAKR